MLGDRRWGVGSPHLGNLTLFLPGCGVLGKLLNFSDPQFPVLSKGPITSSCLLELTEAVKLLAQAGE